MSLDTGAGSIDNIEPTAVPDGPSRLVKYINGLAEKDLDVVIDTLFDACGPAQRWKLQQRLPELLFRDFFKDLPAELLDKVLRYLDAPNLLNCLKVSKLWNQRLLANENLWKVEAKRIGWADNPTIRDDASCFQKRHDGLHEIPPIFSWKNACIKTLKLRRLLKNGMYFEHKTVRDVAGQNIDIAAIDYNNGCVALATSKLTGLENGTARENVIIWSLAENRSLCCIPVPQQVAVIKLCYPDIVICGHLDGFTTKIYLKITKNVTEKTQSATSSSYNPKYEPSVSKLDYTKEIFRAHTSAVISLDVDKGLGLLATGSADGSIIFWELHDYQYHSLDIAQELDTTQRIKTLSDFSHWVVKIILKSSDDHSVISHSGRNLLFSMTRDNITLHSWDHESTSFKETKLEARYTHLKKLMAPDYILPLKTNPTWGLRDVFFTPGLHLVGDKLAFVKQMPMFETPTIGDADIVLADAGTGQILNKVHVNQKVRKLLSVGKRFAVILLPYVDSRYKNLAVVDLKERQIIGGYTVPHSRPSTPDFSQVTTGDLLWLDGITEEQNSNEFVTGLVIDHSALHLVLLSNKI